MASLRTLAWTLPALLLTAGQVLAPLAAHAAAASASPLTREICTPQDAREAAAGSIKGQGKPEIAEEKPLPVQALVNLHVHETPVGITRSIAVCSAPGALPPVQQPEVPASRPHGRS